MQMVRVKDVGEICIKGGHEEEKKAWRELLTSIQKVVNALVFPQGREVKVVHQCIQAILKGEEKG